MSQYAADTQVSSERSRAELEKTLARYGADEFGYMTNRQAARIQFSAENRIVRFTIPLPDRDAREFTHTPTRGTRRTAQQIEAAYEQAVRQRWRALNLVVKAKLEAVASGIVTFEQEFLPHIMLPGGQTVYEATAAGIEAQYLGDPPRPLLEITNGRP